MRPLLSVGAASIGSVISAVMRSRAAQPTVLNRFGNMAAGNRLRTGQVGDGAGDLENAVNRINQRASLSCAPVPGAGLFVLRIAQHRPRIPAPH